MKAVAKTQVGKTPALARAGAAAPIAEQGRGSNWIHEALGVVATPDCGFGVVALDDIPKGTLLVVYGGSVITASEFESLSKEMQNFPFQVAEDLFLGPRDEGDVGIGERVNHSCSPNVGFSGAISLVALRDISAGEELGLDYATCVSSNDDAFTMMCSCGASNCRTIITGQDWRSAEIQARLLPYYQPFLREKAQREFEGEGARKLVRLSAVRNDDEIVGLSTGSIPSRGIAAIPRTIGAFGVNAIREEWMAIPICVIAGLPSTLITTAIMAVMAPSIAAFDFARSSTSFIATVSLVSSMVGYVTYLLSYYAGMLIKERRDWMVDGVVNRNSLRRKLKVCWYDFIAHLPYDFWVMPVMGAVTGGFFVAGLSQFWAILLAQTLADVAYAIKEPFFWHGAKQLVAWREKQVTGAATVPDRTV